MDNSQNRNKNDIAGFIDLLLLSLVSDAYFSKAPDGSCLYKQNMGAAETLHVHAVNENSAEAIGSFMDSFISQNRYSRQSSQVFHYFLHISGDYSSYAASLDPVMKLNQELCDCSRILAEFVIIDLKSGTFRTISGRRLVDKSIKRVIAKLLGEVSSNNIETSALAERKRDEIKKQRTSLRVVHEKRLINPVIFLIVINALIFILGYVMEIRIGVDMFVEYGIQDNALIRSGEVWRLITSMFLHEDIAHITGNMFFLLYIGSIILKYYTNKEFWVLYFVSGFTGNLLSFFFTDYLSLGASGAIMGLGGVLIFRMFFGKNAKLFRGVGNYLIFAFMIFFNLFYGVFAEANIDNYGHFGGFIGGFLLAWLISAIRAKKTAS